MKMSCRRGKTVSCFLFVESPICRARNQLRYFVRRCAADANPIIKPKQRRQRFKPALKSARLRMHRSPKRRYLARGIRKARICRQSTCQTVFRLIHSHIRNGADARLHAGSRGVPRPHRTTRQNDERQASGSIEAWVGWRRLCARVLWRRS